MNRVVFATGTLLLLWIAASQAAPVVVCTTPDGRIHAVDKPPRGCKVQSSYRARPAAKPPPSDDDARALAIRGDIEREANQAAAELETVRRRLATLPEVDPASYANTPPGWHAYEREIADRESLVRSLRGRESELLWRITDLKRDFANLRASLSARGGGMPPGWEPMRCGKCP